MAAAAAAPAGGGDAPLQPPPSLSPLELGNEEDGDDEDDNDGRASGRGSWVAQMDARVEASCIGRYFRLKERGARCSIELVGGLASYLTGTCGI